MFLLRRNYAGFLHAALSGIQKVHCVNGNKNVMMEAAAKDKTNKKLFTMIGKIIIGKSFKGCINYCLEDKTQKEGEKLVIKNRAELFAYNQCFGNKQELIRQFNEVRQLNPKLSKPVLHITLSLAPEEKLSKATLTDMVED